MRPAIVNDNELAVWQFNVPGGPNCRFASSAANAYFIRGLIPGEFGCWGPRFHAQEGIAKIRTFLISCVAAALIASVAAVILYRFQEPAEVAFSTSSVRI